MKLKSGPWFTPVIQLLGRQRWENHSSRPAPAKKLARPYLKKQAWWCISVIPAMQEAEVRESQSEDHLSKKNVQDSN
jgi:hypothetical protein